MKILAVAPDRPQDDVDLRSLINGLTAVERHRAREAVAKIEVMGANRGKALREQLEHRLDPLGRR
jgi:hypothetical protein